MDESKNKIVVRCRAIIVHDDKLLVVKHGVDVDYYALPGGHLEWGEGIQDCMRREIVEELGIEPKIGRLLYINNLIQPKEGSLPAKQSIEFFFEVTNSNDYFKAKELGGTHKSELVEICWIGKNDQRRILPDQIQTDLNNGTILSDTVRFI